MIPVITPIIIDQTDDDEYTTCPKCGHRFKQDPEPGGCLTALAGILVSLAIVAGIIFAMPYFVAFLDWAWK